MYQMSPELLGKIRLMIAQGDTRPFYRTRIWRRVRLEVLAEDKNECQRCKAAGCFTEANTVHHVRYLDKYPDLALSKSYQYQGKEYKNLISLCHKCHDEIHGHGMKKKIFTPITEERW